MTVNQLSGDFRMKIILALAALFAPPSEPAAQIVIAPAVVYLNPAGNAGYSDLVLQSVGVRAASAGSIGVKRMTIALLAHGQVVESRILPGDQLAFDSSALMSAPAPQFIDSQLLASGGLSGFFNAPTTPASSAQLRGGEALVTSRQYFAVRAPVDSVEVSLDAVDLSGKPMTFTRAVPVQQRKSPIDYHSPLAGEWVMQSIPSLQSHHRLNGSTEFAVDFMKADAGGRVYNGDILKPENYYAYGAPVRAAADGVVVRVIDGAVQDRAAMTRRPGETPQAAGQRIGGYNMSRIKSDFARAVAGNLVVIRHQAAGTTEYSSYGHLKAGITVREGQAVKQGEVIGFVGDTGDSATVHLHFQLNQGPDPFTSPSLPVQFSDQRPVQGNTEPGRFVETQ